MMHGTLNVKFTGLLCAWSTMTLYLIKNSLSKTNSCLKKSSLTTHLNILHITVAVDNNFQTSGSVLKWTVIHSRSNKATSHRITSTEARKRISQQRAWHIIKCKSSIMRVEAIADRLQRPHYLSRVDHERKIRSRRQSSDVGKYYFVEGTIQHWNQLPAEVLRNLPSKIVTFKKRVRKVIIELN